MDSQTVKTRIYAGIATVSIFAAGIFLLNINSLKDDIKESIKESEKLKTEKSSLFDSYKNSKEREAVLASEKKENISKISSLQKNLDASSNDLKISKQLNSRLKSQKILLESDKKKLLSQLSRLEASSNTKDSEINELRITITKLQSEIDRLNKIIDTKPTNVNIFEVSAQKGTKNKVTLKAARADKIVAKCELPGCELNTISCKLITPKGEVRDSRQSDEFSVSKASENDKNSNLYIVQYLPKNKLAKGSYQIKVFNSDSEISSFKINLK